MIIEQILIKYLWDCECCNTENTGLKLGKTIKLNQNAMEIKSLVHVMSRTDI